MLPIATPVNSLVQTSCVGLFLWLVIVALSGVNRHLFSCLQEKLRDMPRKESTRSWVHYSGRTFPHSPVWPLWHLKTMVQGPSKDPWLFHSMPRWQNVNQLFHADQATCSGQPHFTTPVGPSWIPYIRRRCLWWLNLSLPQQGHAREQGSGNEFQVSRP